MDGTAPHLSPSFANAGWSGCSRAISLHGKHRINQSICCVTITRIGCSLVATPVETEAGGKTRAYVRRIVVMDSER